MASGNHLFFRIFKKTICPAVVFTLLATWPAFGLFGGKIDSFSADQVYIDKNGKNMGTAKLYITPDAYRMDGIPGGGPGGMTIVNISVLGFNNKNQQYIYNHDKKLVFESNMDEESMMKDLESYSDSDDVKVLGKEKVSGYDCVKKQVTSTSRVMGMTITSTTIIWESDRLEMPLRTRSDDGSIMELRNIDVSAPSKKHFRLMPGYKKVDSMMALMGMDFSRMMADDDEDEPAGNASGGQVTDMDLDEMMAGMKEMMGDNVDPEQMAQMRQAMGNAFAKARQIDMDSGAAEGLWKIIPKRSGDTVADEMKAPRIYSVVMGTGSSFSAVCADYKKKLNAAGWRSGGQHIQNGKGFANFMKGDATLTISSSDNPGTSRKFKTWYSLQLNSPDL